MNKPTITIDDVLSYDVILVSYSFALHQWLKKEKYLERIGKVNEDGESLKGHMPERPVISIFSTLLELLGEQYPYLVLDEVHMVKNRFSKTHRAILELREKASVCIMLSGSPLDNNWSDMYAISQFVNEHPFRSQALWNLVFAENVNHRISEPWGDKLKHLVSFMGSFTVRRPETILDLPELEMESCLVRLTEGEREASNAAYGEYLKCRSKIHDGMPRKVRQQILASSMSGLVRAQQHAYHPAMTLIMKHVRLTANGVDEDETVDHNSEDWLWWRQWRENLRQDRNWESSRVSAITNEFNRMRFTDPHGSVVIFSESIYFLDIVEIALANTEDPVQVLRYDGRTPTHSRDEVLRQFEASTWATALLMTRGAGGIGLNITSASNVILCEPWWKKSQEEQAMKRVYRQGQRKVVTVVSVKAQDCDAETYKSKKRDHKDRHNREVLRRLTGNDGEPIELPDRIERIIALDE